MTKRNRSSGPGGRSEHDEEMKKSGGQREPMRDGSGDSGSGSDRSSSNIGRNRHSGSGTSGSREESMEGSARGGAGSERGAYGSENLTDDDLAAGGRSASGSRSVSGNTGTDRSGRGNTGQLGDEWESDQQSGAMRGSSSGTTGLGGERRQSSTGSPGGVEGITDKSSPNPDEDLSRNR